MFEGFVRFTNNYEDCLLLKHLTHIEFCHSLVVSEDQQCLNRIIRTWSRYLALIENRRKLPLSDFLEESSQADRWCIGVWADKFYSTHMGHAWIVC